MSGTIARPTTSNESHWYYPDSTPCHTVIAKSTKQPRPTTLGDAKKMGLYPSVTNVLRILHKEALVQWRCEQVALAIATTPHPEEEPLDAFIQRVLHDEKQHEQEAEFARELGTLMHDGMEKLLRDEVIEPMLHEWIDPAFNHLKGILTQLFVTEHVLVGRGYAGTADVIGFVTSGVGNFELIVDFKTTKKPPSKGSWMEHRLQLAAYAAARAKDTKHPVRTANLYISTTEIGKFEYFENPPWEPDFHRCFAPLLMAWCHMNNYEPPTQDGTPPDRIA